MSYEDLSAVDRQTPELCQDDSPFYLSINHKHKPGSHRYKKQPLGIHTKSMPYKTSILPGRNCVVDSAVMKRSGHKSIQSLNHYNRPSLEQQKHVSFAQQLSNIVTHAGTTFCVHSVTTSSFRSVTVSSCCSTPTTLCQFRHTAWSCCQSNPTKSSCHPLSCPVTFSSFCQVQTPASLPSPLQQLIIKEHLNFALKLKTKHTHESSIQTRKTSILLYGLLSST